jgi:hypothetical protein
MSLIRHRCSIFLSRLSIPNRNRLIVYDIGYTNSANFVLPDSPQIAECRDDLPLDVPLLSPSNPYSIWLIVKSQT